MFLAGAIPIVGLHPWMMNVFLPTVLLVGRRVWNEPVPRVVVDAVKKAERVWETRGTWRVMDVSQRLLPRWNLGIASKNDEKGFDVNENENENDDDDGTENENGNDTILGKSRHTVLETLIQRIIDNDRLPDACWNADMREVELWENERYAGPMSAESISASVSLNSSLTSLANAVTAAEMAAGGPTSSPKSRVYGSWSKSNLRSTERRAWTRRRDGSESGGLESGVDAEGEVKYVFYNIFPSSLFFFSRVGTGKLTHFLVLSSTLTFPLAPGWSFVHTEDWRRDVTAEWAVEECSGGIACGDEDGWVYSNDVWLDLRRSPVGAGEEGRGPYVTRRRRWVRRVWYDPVRARM